MGGLGVKVQHFPLTLLVVLTTLTLPCKRDYRPLTHITEQANIYILKVQQQLPLKPVYQLSQKYYLPHDKKISWLDKFHRTYNYYTEISDFINP